MTDELSNIEWETIEPYVPPPKPLWERIQIWLNDNGIFTDDRRMPSRRPRPGFDVWIRCPSCNRELWSYSVSMGELVYDMATVGGRRWNRIHCPCGVLSTWDFDEKPCPKLVGEQTIEEQTT